MQIKRSGNDLIDVWLENSSYVIEEVMGDHLLYLSFRIEKPVNFEINDYVEFGGNTFKIRYKEKIEKEETELGWEYSMTLYSSKYELQDVIFFLHGKPERRKNFNTYNGTASQMLALIVQNMNRESSGWSVGSCIETEFATFTFTDKNCGAVLDDVAKAFETEYWIEGKSISIGKREYSNPGLILGQGEGMGFRTLELNSVDQKPPVTVLYPYGSDKNLAANDYGHDYLVLPDNKLSLDKNVEKYGRFEESKQFEHIFPRGIFKVVKRIDEVTFISDVDFDIAAHLIDGEEVIVTFQDGGLAGYDLAILTKDKGQWIGWDNEKKQITLAVNDQENALKVPGDIHFSEGDTFILTGLKMPQKYIEDAEQRLLEAAETYLEENCEKKIQVSGKCDDIFFRKFGIFIACGQMVGIVSEELDIDREIRAIKVKKYLENEEQPYRYELTLSDFLDTNGFKDLVNDVNKFPDEIESNIRPVKEWTKRSWRDVMETFRMMFDPEGEYFTELIKPLAVHTAQLIVGTNSQQFELVGIRFIPNANHNANAFQSTAGRLIHFTVNQDGITEWTIPVSSYSLNNSYPYYVYARCSKTAASGTIIATTEQIKLEAKDGYYHFWIGVLNTPQDGVRSWNPNYGYTEIAGQTITTGIIKDKNSNLVIDLTKGTLTGYGNITDKPDLSGFASKSELKVLGDEISLSVTREINGVKQDLSKIEAKADQINIQVEGLKDGDTLVSYINLSKTTAIISSKRIKLEGYITANEHFKIDEDGDMECINGKFSGQITATSGTIGGFSIASSYIGVAASGTETTGATGFSISPTLIRYSNSSIWAGFGSYVFPASMGGSFNCPMRISMNTGEYSSDYKYGNIGIYLNVSGKATYDDVELSGNHALYIPEGYITGFRLRPRRISSTTTLTNLDSWIFGIGSNTFTLYLPSSPKDGQIYFIRKVTSGNINITVSNSAHKLRRNWNAEDTSVTLKDGNMAIIMWDNVNKYWTCNYCPYM